MKANAQAKLSKTLEVAAKNMPAERKDDSDEEDVVDARGIARRLLNVSDKENSPVIR